jgi:hypothetical protein
MLINAERNKRMRARIRGQAEIAEAPTVCEKTGGVLPNAARLWKDLNLLTHRQIGQLARSCSGPAWRWCDAGVLQGRDQS